MSTRTSTHDESLTGLDWWQTASRHELLGDDAIDVQVEAEDLVACNERHRALTRALRHLSERERRVLALRHGLARERTHTLQEVGDRLGLTRERVRQIEAEALCKLRESCELQELQAREAAA